MISDCRFQIADLGKQTRRSVLLVAALVLLWTSTASALALSARQILEKASKNYDAVNDYVVDAKLTVESPQMHVPEMLVNIYYKKPNKLHVDSKGGFAMLPKQGAFVGNPLRDMQSISDLTIGRSEKILGADCWVIKGTFDKNDRATQTTVWVDKKYNLVRQISANPEWGPSISAKLWYMRVGNRYWLPQMTSARISIPPLPDERVDTKRKPGGPTIVTLKFSNYRVNTGLNDKIFEKQEGGK